MTGKVYIAQKQKKQEWKVFIEKRGGSGAAGNKPLC